jgi:hypothetical protein
VASDKAPVSDEHVTRAILVVRGDRTLLDETLARLCLLSSLPWHSVAKNNETQRTRRQRCLVSRCRRGAD